MAKKPNPPASGTPKPSMSGGPVPRSGVIFRRFRKVRGGKILDAHDYGYEAWPIPIGPR